MNRERRLLIVSPYFPPTNGADCHRVRVLAPLMKDQGWGVDVLAVDPKYHTLPQDPWLETGVPDEVRVYRAHALPLHWSKVPGFGTIAIRAKHFMKRMGTRLLEGNAYDLVYFSTTAFGLFALGPYWKKRFRVPFVVDYQDPWITDYYRQHPEIIPPGGRLKYGIVERLSRYREPRVLRECAGITSVSPEYPKELIERYPWLAGIPTRVLPFPGARRDFDRLKREKVQQDIFDPYDGAVHWVSVGVSGPIMNRALGCFFRALSQARRERSLPTRLRLYFIGTSYAPPGTAEPVVLPIADRFGVADLVREQTDRIPYSTALRVLMDADALLAFGSDDPTYNASKLLPYILANKPLLTIFHRGSPATSLLQRVRGSCLVTFADLDSDEEIVDRVRLNWMEGKRHSTIVPFILNELEKYTDDGQVKELCEFFNSIVKGTESKFKSGHPGG